MTDILWGALIDGMEYGFQNPPWQMRALDVFEAHARKKVSILHFAMSWSRGGVAQPFYPAPLQACRDRGVIPLVDWCSWDQPLVGTTQPAFNLSSILSGAHDAYITAWATGAAAWGHPFFLRFDHEMNGNWYPWAEGQNGNTAGQYAAAWRHVHDLFVKAGCLNATWVFCPNAGPDPVTELYPGDAYVDWVGLDGYNKGSQEQPYSQWRTFDTIFNTSLRALAVIAPSKPVMICETASSELGGDKAIFIHQLFSLLTTRKIRAICWFNRYMVENGYARDWPIETSWRAQAAFAGAISDPRYIEGGPAFSTITGKIT